MPATLSRPKMEADPLRIGLAMNLSVSNLFFELALIFLPGFVWMKIHKKYGFKGEATQFDLILNAFIFGVVSYLVLLLIYRPFGKSLDLFQMDTETKRLLQPEIVPDIFAAVVVATVLSIVHLYAENYKILTRMVQKIRATKTFGDEDVWDFVFNSPSPSVDLIHLRDFEQQVVYAGRVDKFSEGSGLRELMLKEVAVYDFDGVLIYEVPRLYLARMRENLHIEFPQG